MRQFSPTQDFFSQEFQSQYIKGLMYTVRPADALLEKLVMEPETGWLATGKVELVDASLKTLSRMEGKGKVVQPGGIFRRIKSWL